MRKIYFAGIFSVLAVVLGYSQNIPQGMNYQAVARDNGGNELKNQQISLQITLYNPQAKDPYYIETQSVTTNEFGLFSLVIGQGSPQSGTFAKVPWSQDEIWMQVGIQTAGQSGFTPIGSSKLYAVPYAFFAGSLANQDTTGGELKSLAPGGGQCPCNGGIKSLSVLYLGPSGVTIRVYNNQALQNTGLIQTFTAVNNGAVLTINVPANIGTLQNETYFQFSAIPNSPAVVAVPTVCSSNYSATNPASPGGTWGNISVISQTDQNGETCTACNVNGLWYLGGNAVMAACNTLGTLSNNDLVLISNNTPRMVISAGGDVTVDNNLNVNEGLNVLGNVALNQSNGATTNNGPFTVANSSPATLTGTLTTDGATQLNNTLTVSGATNLNSTLNVNNQQLTDLTGNLVVNRATKLDSSLWVGGNTNLHGYLHVDEQAPAVFTGTIEGYKNATFDDQVLLTNASLNSSGTSSGALVVAGGVGIGQTVYVGGPTFLLNSLSVGGNTDLYGYLHVDNQSPTVLTGTLADSGNATFFQHLTLTNPNINSSTPGDGELLVDGGVGIGENLNVGGASTFKGPVSFGSVVDFTDTVQSTSYTNGTIICAGGVGIAKNVNINGSTVINSAVSGDHSSPGAYPLTVEGSNQGIRVQVIGNSGGISDMTNNYMQFVDNTGNARGSITGETTSDVINDHEYQATEALYVASVAFATYELSVALDSKQKATNALTAAQNEEEEATNNLEIQTNDVAIETENMTCTDIQSEEDINTEIGDDAATTICAGFGVCETVPPVSDIVAATANVIEGVAEDAVAGDEEALAADNEATAATNEGLATTNVGLATTNLGIATLKVGVAETAETAAAGKLAAYTAQKLSGLPGVYFNSSSGDYAEWLPKTNPSEKIYQGDIVGVKGGKISKQTEGAEKLMVVSTMPIVLGNAPPEDKKSDYEKVAFIGQVQTKVFGKVQPGDYILCAEGATGFGLAKHPADMAPEDYQRIVGIAWEGSDAKGMSYVNTAVGLNTNDMARLAIKQQSQLKAQEDEINTLKQQIGEINANLAKLAAGSTISLPVSANSVNAAPAANAGNINNTNNATASAPAVTSEPGTVRYLELTREEFDKAFALAEAQIRKAGRHPENNPFLKKIEEDPSYKDQIYAQLKERYSKGVEIHKQINSDLKH